MSTPRTVRLWPVEGVSVWPWPAVEFDATPEDAAFLLAHVPPPFTDRPPGARPVIQPTEAPRGASPDSEV